MRIPKLAIDNYQFTIILMIALVLSGIVSFVNMPRTEDPPVSKSGASVIVIYPGATPADLEQLVVDPLEEALNELEDLNQINSKMEDGLAVINAEFMIGTDPDEKYSDVVQKTNSVRNDLPQDILGLDMMKWSVADVNILQLAFVSESANYRTLEKLSDDLKKGLEKVSGVRRVRTWAFPQQEVRVSVYPEKLVQMRIPVNQVIRAIQNANVNIPGGYVDIGTKRFNIHTSGNYKTIDDIRNTIVHTDGSKIVFLKDVADIDFDYEDRNYHARYDGKQAIFLTVNQKERTNIFHIMDDIRPVISQFQETLPENIKLEYVFDQSVSVSDRVNSFVTNLLQGIVLVGVVIFLFLSIRASVIVMLAIPFSILIGIGFVDLSGYGIQQMTIAGMVIALGILVDNAIVVTENISRFLKRGYDGKEAAIQGMNQIAWAIVSATVTTVLAFIPIMMIGDITGDFIRSMPVTVVYTLLASLVIALTLTPYLSTKLLKVEKIQKENRFQRLITYIIESPYRKTLAFALTHRKIVISSALLVLLGSLALFPFIGISFFPKAEKPQFLINIEAPKGTSFDQTNEVALYVESVIREKDKVEHYTTNIGRGNPRIYYNVIEQRENSTFAQLFIQLERYEHEEMNQFVAELRDEFSTYPDARIEIKELEQGPPVEAPIAIKVLGDKLDMLRDISRDIEQIIRETNGTININNPLSTSKTDLHININRDKAAMLGLPLVEIDRIVRMSIAGMPISTYRDPQGKNYNIVVRLPVESKTTLKDFDRIYLASMTGAIVPLKQVASIEFKAGPMQINHHNLERNVTLTADVISGFSVDLVTRDIIAELKKYDWPNGYRDYIGGELESRQESFGGMQKAILIAIISIFGVLVLQFRSFTQPLVVFSAIPLAVIGSVLALFITRYSFSFTAFVGLTSLVGIVVNNSIIMVDYTNKLRDEGKGLLEALKEAGETRFRPIILTTATTIGGLLPLTLRGGTLWAPMGWTIIGGLIVSTFLTLVIVPVLYKVFTVNSES